MMNSTTENQFKVKYTGKKAHTHEIEKKETALTMWLVVGKHDWNPIR